ncbi:hypothetical protein E2562_013371 [Oryza meyeriana var. granulata]|uniref:Uncharacterized protein n=1 Tax=Oryza meyeriana var. granulata TaxID=110450 RepID=A0A6G1CF88_9ORYZ|nr:hypothetical protein E2562_013371 [Oryza meyeriana var. granulata]
MLVQSTCQPNRPVRQPLSPLGRAAQQEARAGQVGLPSRCTDEPPPPPHVPRTRMPAPRAERAARFGVLHRGE